MLAFFCGLLVFMSPITLVGFAGDRLLQGIAQIQVSMADQALTHGMGVFVCVDLAYDW